MFSKWLSFDIDVLNKHGFKLDKDCSYVHKGVGWVADGEWGPYWLNMCGDYVWIYQHFCTLVLIDQHMDSIQWHQRSSGFVQLLEIRENYEMFFQSGNFKILLKIREKWENLEKIREFCWENLEKTREFCLCTFHFSCFHFQAYQVWGCPVCLLNLLSTCGVQLMYICFLGNTNTQ